MVYSENIVEVLGNYNNYCIILFILFQCIIFVPVFSLLKQEEWTQLTLRLLNLEVKLNCCKTIHFKIYNANMLPVIISEI